METPMVMETNTDAASISEESREEPIISNENTISNLDEPMSTEPMSVDIVTDEASCSQLPSSSELPSEDSQHRDEPLVFANPIQEYCWPQGSSHRYFIQEQLSEFLDVKSFKRKYPDLNRRVINDLEEETYLLNNSFVNAIQLTMGLTALRSEDVYDLMMQDYPQKFEEYQKALAARNKQELEAEQRELQAVKSDSKRLEEWRRKAIIGASDWNSELNRERSRTRRCFFDVQTMIIQEPQKKITARTTFGSYPVALIPGQFQTFYKNYAPEELNELPLNTVFDIEPYLQAKRSASPGCITVTKEELIAPVEAEEKKKKEPTNTATKHATVSRKNSERSIQQEESRQLADYCAFCQEDMTPKSRYVRCSKCGSCGHPGCMDMSDEMYNVIKSYNWMCMECKPCSICSKLDGEDKMLFCDRCDRGYHTFCVGLNELPSGRWVCPKYCGRSTINDQTTETTPKTATKSNGVHAATVNGKRRSSVSSSASETKRRAIASPATAACPRCGVPVVKSRRRVAQLCSNCRQACPSQDVQLTAKDAKPLITPKPEIS